MHFATMHYMSFLHVIFCSLRGRRAHAALLIVTLATTVAATTLLFGAVWGFAGASVASFEAHGVDLVAVRAGVVERTNSSLRMSQAELLRQVPGIADVDGVLMESVSFDESGIAGVPLVGRDATGFYLSTLKLSAGECFRPGERKHLLLGAGLAQALRKNVGDALEVEGTEFRIGGVFFGDNPLETNLAIAPLADVQELMDRDGQVSQFEIRVADRQASESTVREVCRRIQSLRDESGRLLGLQALPARAFVNTGVRSQLAGATAWGVTSLAVALSGLGVLNTMLISVLERTREIGMLRAVGWSRSRIIALYLGESFVLYVAAAILGLLLAAVTAAVVSHIPAIAELTGPMISLKSTAFGVLPAALAVAAGALYPAWRAASVPATEALRYE